MPVETNDLHTPRRDEHMNAVVVLDRLRSAYNTGNIFRIAEALRVKRIIACGYTPAPPHPKLEKTARGCETLVECIHYESSGQAVRALKKQGFTVYAVETATTAVSLWELKIKFPAAFVFGNEALGVDETTLELCDACIQLPRFGRKNSINVGNAAAATMYEAARQWFATS